MTFLIFLASLAVLEYLVRDTGRKSGKRESVMLRQAVEPVPAAPGSDSSTADLLALGQALGVARGTVETSPAVKQSAADFETTMHP